MAVSVCSSLITPLAGSGAGPAGPDLDRGLDAARDEFAFVVERRQQDRRDAADAFDADAVVRREIAEAVGDEPVVVDLQRPHHVRTVAEHDVGAGVDHGVRELHHVAAILAGEDLARERQHFGAIAFGAAVKRHDDDVVFRGQLRHQRQPDLRIVERVRAHVGRKGHHGDAPAVGDEARDGAFAARNGECPPHRAPPCWTNGLPRRNRARGCWPGSARRSPRA